MSSLLYHAPCPKCGSRDNLGVYDDGHSWCFGCGYHNRTTKSLKDVELFQEKEKYSHKDVNLPADLSNAISGEALRWLRSYDLTNKEIAENAIGWSQREEMLIFPYYDDYYHLLMWQGRYFPTRKPKSFTVGYPENHIIIKGDRSKFDGDSRTSVVIVEDPVSQIKVARQTDCCCLFGSHLSLHKSIGLSRYYDNLFLWLDNDKIKEMVKFTNRYTHLFKNVKMIISDKDPKCHTDDEIKKYLTDP